MDTKAHEWEWLGCSRGRSPRIVLKPGRPIAFPNGSAALTADFADVADEQVAEGLADLLFQAMGYVMRSRIAPQGGNHGWTRIHPDPVPWSFGLLCLWTFTSG